MKKERSLITVLLIISVLLSAAAFIKIIIVDLRLTRALDNQLTTKVAEPLDLKAMFTYSEEEVFAQVSPFALTDVSSAFKIDGLSLKNLKRAGEEYGNAPAEETRSYQKKLGKIFIDIISLAFIAGTIAFGIAFLIVVIRDVVKDDKLARRRDS